MNIFLRKITALFPKMEKKKLGFINQKHFSYQLSLFLFIVFALVAAVLLQLLVFLTGKVNKTKQAYESQQREFIYWSSVASQFPTIPDVLYNASLSAYKAGKTEQAIE